MRQIEKIVRDQIGEKATQTVCETQEVYQRLCKKYRINDRNKLDDELNRRQKKGIGTGQDKEYEKNAFNMNSGTVKICTVHSIKGWEINTLVLIIDETDVNDEVVYTAITRAKKNLLAIDCGNDRYGEFFQQEFIKP